MVEVEIESEIETTCFALIYILQSVSFLTLLFSFQPCCYLICLGDSFGADKSDLSEPTSDEQNSCYPFTNRILDELCISISNMLLNSLQPMVGPFRTGKSNLVGSTSKLSKKVPDEITTVASGNEKKKQ